MCQSFAEIKGGKLVRTKGRFKHGHWTICLECGLISLNKDKGAQENWFIDAYKVSKKAKKGGGR